MRRVIETLTKVGEWFNERSKLTKLFIIAFLAFFPLNFIATMNAPDVEEVNLPQIVDAVQADDAGEVYKELQMNDYTRVVTLIPEDKTLAHQTSSYPTDYGVTLMEVADEAGVEVNISNAPASPGLMSSIIALAPLILIVAIIIYLLKSNPAGGQSNKTIAERPTTRFTDIAGVDEAIEDLGEITDFLRSSEDFTKMGAVSPKGVLMHGPPGTGKTLLARAVAGETGVPYFHVSGSDFIELFVGLGARRVRQLFKEARKYDRAIIFFDEIDSIGGKRAPGNSGGGDSREHNRTVNALLAEMDGFVESNIIILAATNNPDELDPALTRSGRFDRKVTVALPDWKGRLGILKIHSRNKAVDSSVNFEAIAKSTTGLSGADLANLVNEALINAVRNHRASAVQEDFMEALSTLTLGRARTSVAITDADKKITAWHEAGHAVVSLALPSVPDPTHVTIIPRGMSGGHTKLQESEEKFHTSERLRGQLAMSLGGLVAEKLTLGDITQGPGSDLQAATNLAQDMVTKMGMGSSLSVIDSNTLQFNSSISNSVRKQVEELLNTAEETAHAILTSDQWRPVFEAMANELLEVDTIETDAIQVLKAIGLHSNEVVIGEVGESEVNTEVE